MGSVTQPGKAIKLPSELQNDKHQPMLRYRQGVGWWFFCTCGTSSRAEYSTDAAIGRAINHVDMSARTYEVTFRVNGEALYRVRNALKAFQRGGVVDSVTTKEVKD